MLVPSRDDSVRLVLKAQHTSYNNEVSFAKTSKCLEAAFARVPSLGKFTRPRLEVDQLVLDQSTDRGVTRRICVDRNGVLFMSESLLGDANGRAVKPSEVLSHMASMASFARIFFKTLAKALHRGLAAVTTEWSFEDLAGGVRILDLLEWSRPTPNVALTSQAQVSTVTCPAITWPPGQGVSRENIATQLHEALTELFFPFEGADGDQTLCRLEPSLDEVNAVLTSRNLIDIFGYIQDGHYIET